MAPARVPARIISHHIISYHFISYRIISYHIISYHIISYHIISYHIISYYIISYHIVSYTVLPRCIGFKEGWIIWHPRVYPRGCHIIQPSLNPCIISIHAEPARVICRAGRKSNNVRFFPHRMAKTHGDFQKMTSHKWTFPCIAACLATFVRINLNI